MPRDVAAGTSLLGPHRDDMAFAINEHDLRTFGSRGQQRTAALALKLGEVQLMRDETKDNPLLLLDDVMSELDATRRHTLLEALGGVTQVIATTTDWNDFSADLLREARALRVEAGVLGGSKCGDLNVLLFSGFHRHFAAERLFAGQALPARITFGRL